jgi:hypothetical protein
MNFKYRGRIVTAEDILFIRKLIAENPADTRRGLSYKLCRAWNWVQPNGALRDMVCRGLMLELHRAGHIELPKKKNNPHNPLSHRKKPNKVEIDQTPIQKKISECPPIEIRQVRRSGSEKLFNSLIEHYHYLGYTQPVGEHLKHIVYMGERPVTCLAWSSAPRHIGCRDRFIGWPVSIRKSNLHLIAYNTRFLILPWVRVPHLASHILGRVAKVVSTHWQSVYQHPVHFLETFVDTERFKGTCYQAANWIYMGDTTGRGKNDHTYKPNRSIKAALGYPLSKNFRWRLCEGTHSEQRK